MLVPMLDWTQCAAVERVPGKVSGAWVFKGTRVAWFPGVTRDQGEAVLEQAERSLGAA
jgi:hypothetical protein